MKLIDKDALVAEINRVLNSYDPNEITSGRYALVDLRNFIDTLEVKGIDLNKEIDRVWDNLPDTFLTSQHWSEFQKVAKHFFELGLKAQKGE